MREDWNSYIYNCSEHRSSHHDIISTREYVICNNNTANKIRTYESTKYDGQPFQRKGIHTNE